MNNLVLSPEQVSNKADLFTNSLLVHASRKSIGVLCSPKLMGELKYDLICLRDNITIAEFVPAPTFQEILNVLPLRIDNNDLIYQVNNTRIQIGYGCVIMDDYSGAIDWLIVFDDWCNSDTNLLQLANKLLDWVINKHDNLLRQ